MKIPKEEFTARQQSLRRIMAERGLDAVCIAGSAQLDTRGVLRYFTDYYLPVFEEYLLVTRERSFFFVHDGCGADYAKRFCAVDEIKIIPEADYNFDPAKPVADVLKELGCKNIGTCWGRQVSAGFCNSFAKHTKGISSADISMPVHRLRAVKSPAEIALMREAVKFNEKILDFYLSQTAAGKTEIDAVNKASLYALEQGAEDLYWMTASGKTPSLAYLAASRQQKHTWQQGDYHYVVLEHSVPGGCYSEITQLISLGKPKKEYEEAYKAVTEAQKAAASAAKTGQPVSKLAEASHKVLCELGYCAKESPVPCIGHSQGLDAWEFPRIAADETMTVQPGMRFNIHPAVILPDGAKITSCQSWLATENGCEQLSTLSDKIIVL
ncbi:MAG: M24 family metallopeptidase [Synergistaceae bacterium]|nr:M24 family metallopeptidase [Synergistaceae bacterium]